MGKYAVQWGSSGRHPGLMQKRSLDKGKASRQDMVFRHGTSTEIDMTCVPKAMEDLRPDSLTERGSVAKEFDRRTCTRRMTAGSIVRVRHTSCEANGYRIHW